MRLLDIPAILRILNHVSLIPSHVHPIVIPICIKILWAAVLVKLSCLNINYPS